MFEDMEYVVNNINHLIIGCSMLHIQNGKPFLKSVSFFTNRVPTKTENDIIQECLFKTLKIQDANKDQNKPFAPQSVVHLILKGFDYFTNHYNRCPKDILTSTQVLKRMKNCVHLNGLSCVCTPRVIRSKGSNDMAVVFMDVWDSQNGFNTSNIVNKMYHLGGKLIHIEYARPREFVPQCQKCWLWTHSTKGCRINHQKCARCHGGHQTENHNMYGYCCNEERKKLGHPVKCEHKARCVNCKGEHKSNSFKCIYKKHQNNSKWHSQ
jgi:hypothetical protein